MLHEFLVRMLGIGMAGLLNFGPIKPVFRNDSLHIAADLANPVTSEVNNAVMQGYAFRIEYSFSVIVNDRKSFESVWINSLTYDSLWRVNGAPVPTDSIAGRMGAAVTAFPRLRFEAGDELMVFAKAKIMEDSGFTQSTGLPASILWNYFVPRTETHWIFGEGRFRAR